MDLRSSATAEGSFPRKAAAAAWPACRCLLLHRAGPRDGIDSAAEIDKAAAQLPPETHAAARDIFPTGIPDIGAVSARHPPRCPHTGSLSDNILRRESPPTTEASAAPPAAAERGIISSPATHTPQRFIPRHGADDPDEGARRAQQPLLSAADAANISAAANATAAVNATAAEKPGAPPGEDPEAALRAIVKAGARSPEDESAINRAVELLVESKVQDELAKRLIARQPQSHPEQQPAMEKKKEAEEKKKKSRCCLCF
eukprot:COSAG05_NODE_96_length_19480_cov_549.594367_2_plen_258_part_00